MIPYGRGLSPAITSYHFDEAAEEACVCAVFASAIGLEAAACAACQFFWTSMVVDISGQPQRIDIIVIHSCEMSDILWNAIVIESPTNESHDAVCKWRFWRLAMPNRGHAQCICSFVLTIRFEEIAVDVIGCLQWR